MSPLTPIIVILLLLSAGLYNRFRKSRKSYKISLQEAEIYRESEGIKDQITPDTSDWDLKKLENAMLDMYSRYKHHPSIEGRCKEISREIEHIRLQRTLGYGKRTNLRKI